MAPRAVMTPRVSVLIPAFDCAATLSLALESVRRQSEPDFECVLVDDGSRDETPRIARAYADRDARFRVIPRRHAGLVAALNAGIEACRAPIIARMDGDDVMAKHRLRSTLSRLAQEPELSAVGTRVRSFPRGTLSPKRLEYERWLNGIREPEDVERDAFVECPIAHPTLTIRSHVLRDAAYRDMGWPEDYDLLLRLLAAGRRLAVLPEKLHHWRDTPGRYSRTHPACTLPRFVACKASFLAEGFLRNTSEFILWGYGDTGKALARALALHGKRPSRIVELHPGRIGQRIQGALVIPPLALAQTERRPLLVSVAGALARSLIRGELDRLGYRELRDYVVAA